MAENILIISNYILYIKALSQKYIQIFAPPYINHPLLYGWLISRAVIGQFQVRK